LYVLSALEVDRYKNLILRSPREHDTQAALQSLLDHDAATGGEDGLQTAWHGAEGYHFYLLAQRQFYSGAYESAMKTALRLADYEDVIDPKDVYSLIALSSFHNKHYGTSSKAFIKLEALPDLTDDERKKYQRVAFSIFSTHLPTDPPPKRAFHCPGLKCQAQCKDYDTSCFSCGKNFPACLVSGRAILSKDTHQCRVCKHHMYERELRKFVYCPLCHTILRNDGRSIFD